MRMQNNMVIVLVYYLLIFSKRKPLKTLRKIPFHKAKEKEENSLLVAGQC